MLGYMTTSTHQGHCNHCGQLRVIARRQPNTVVWAALSLLTAGLALPVWGLLAWQASRRPATCTTCGESPYGISVTAVGTGPAAAGAAAASAGVDIDRRFGRALEHVDAQFAQPSAVVLRAATRALLDQGWTIAHSDGERVVARAGRADHAAGAEWGQLSALTGGSNTDVLVSTFAFLDANTHVEAHVLADGVGTRLRLCGRSKDLRRAVARKQVGEALRTVAARVDLELA